MPTRATEELESIEAPVPQPLGPVPRSKRANITLGLRGAGLPSTTDEARGWLVIESFSEGCRFELTTTLRRR